MRQQTLDHRRPDHRRETSRGEELPPSKLDTDLPAGVRDNIMKPNTGDLDEMIKRRVVRIGTTFNRTFYFVDQGVQRGVVYDYGRLIEERLNAHLKTENDKKIHVVFMPLPRQNLLPALVEGKVDLVAAQVTVRPELEKFVDFSKPTRMNVNQILVTAPGSPAVASIDDLSGKEVLAHENSSQYQSLVALNEKFKAAGKPAVDHRDRAGQSRGRRPARDGQCRPDPRHRRRRLPRQILEEGLPEVGRS